MNIIDVITAAMRDAYPTGIAWLDYDLDDGTITIEWVDNTVTRITVQDQP